MTHVVFVRRCARGVLLALPVLAPAAFAQESTAPVEPAADAAPAGDSPIQTMPTEAIPVAAEPAVTPAAPPTAVPAELEPITITASRLPETVNMVPASVSIINGEALRARGAPTLHEALASVAGVEISHGGDNGQAGAVPSFWGLREFDAFLLVVDGVPAGGAFNPALTTLDLNNVERIEVLRGAAPVMYGATSFVGVIHVIHYAAGSASDRASVSIGGVDGFDSVHGDVSSALPELFGWKSSISLNGEKSVFDDPTADLRRSHVLYRGGADILGGALTLDLDYVDLTQHPDSPVALENDQLTTQTPLDANHNFSNAILRETRNQYALGFQLPVSDEIRWETKLSRAKTRGRTIRGYLNLTPDQSADFFEGLGLPDPGRVLADPGYIFEQPADTNAIGYIQTRSYTDNYLDTHLAIDVLPDELKLAVGFDRLDGTAGQYGSTTAYQVGLDGSNRPRSDDPDNVLVESGYIYDERDFKGVYAQAQWTPQDDIQVDAGLRYNKTHEHKYGLEQPSTADPDAPNTDPVYGDKTRDTSKLGYAAGISWRLPEYELATLTVYADYRDTFKPSAFEFGPEFEVFILEPETAKSLEAGVKGFVLGGDLDFDLSVFDMDFRNVVVAEAPGFFNIGRTRLLGAEAEGRYRLVDAVHLLGALALHDATYVEGKDFDNDDLAGKDLALSPKLTAMLGVEAMPLENVFAMGRVRYTGDRALTIDNKASTGGYAELDASVGYRWRRTTISLSGYNLTDSRDPVTASEFAEVLTQDAAYFRNPGRRLALTGAYAFGGAGE